MRKIRDNFPCEKVYVFGATIIPWRLLSAEDNAEVAKINQWIRTSGVFDAVLDFNQILRDPSNPTRLAPQFTVPPPDNISIGLHPNDLGHLTLANSIDLGLFRACCRKECSYERLPPLQQQQRDATRNAIVADTISDSLSAEVKSFIMSGL